MGKKLLTLNIGSSSVTLAEFVASGKGLTLLNYGTATLAASLDSGNAATILSPALHEIMRNTGIRAGKVAISVSGQLGFLRCAAIPMAGGQEKFKTRVRNEIEQNIPFPIDEMVSGSQILGDTANGDKSVLIAASKVEHIENIVDAVKSAGFDPDVIDLAPITLINLLQSRPSYDGSCAIVLDIGAKTTSLSILEGEKLYNRAVPTAGNVITKEIAQILGCSMEEAEEYKKSYAYVSMGGVTEDEDETRDRVSKVCRSVMTRLNTEITRSVNFYRSQQGGGTPTAIYITGGTALLPQLVEFLQDSLQIPVEYLNPFDVASVASSVNTEYLDVDSVLLSANTGLALNAAGLAALSFNLVPPSITEALKEAARIPFVVAGSAAMVLACATWFYTQSSPLEEYAKERDALTSRQAELESNKTFNETQKKKFESESAAAKELSKIIASRSTCVEHINIVRSAIESDNMWISSWKEIETKPQVVEQKPKNSKKKGKATEAENAVVKKTEVTIRCWKDDVEEILKQSGKGNLPAVIVDRLKETGKFDDNKVAANQDKSTKNSKNSKASKEEQLEHKNGSVTPVKALWHKMHKSGTDKEEEMLHEVVLELQFKESECK